MFGNRRAHECRDRGARASGRPVRRDALAPRATMARATTSRGARSPPGSYASMNASPRSLTSRAPSPRSASEIRKRGAPGSLSAVGWNWTNSRSVDARAGPVRERHAVAGRHGGIGRLPEDLAGPPGGEQRRPRPPSLPRSHPRPRTMDARCTGRLRRRAGDDAVVRLHLDGGHAGHARPERARDFASRRVAACSTRRTECAASRPNAGRPRRVAVEARTPVDELPHVARPLIDQHAHRRLVAQAVTRGQRVGGVQRGAVVVAEGGSDAALRVAGIAVEGLGLREDEHASGIRERNRGTQAGDAASDNEEVSVHGPECYPTIAHGARRRPRVPGAPLPWIRSISTSRPAPATIPSDCGRPRRAARAAAPGIGHDGPAVPRVQSADLAPPRTGGVAGPARHAKPMLVPDGERATSSWQTVSRIYDALVRAKPIARRPSSHSAAASSATWPASRRRPTCAACSSCRCRRRCSPRSTRDRRQGRREPPLGKNLIGAFHQPHAVCMDPTVLGTLPAARVPGRPVRGREVRVTSSPTSSTRRRDTRRDLRPRARRRSSR